MNPKRKTKPALWREAFPEQVKATPLKVKAPKIRAYEIKTEPTTKLKAVYINGKFHEFVSGISTGIDARIKRKRIRPVSKRQAQRNAEYRKAASDYLTPRTHCEVCHRPAKLQIHHQRGRAASLLCDVRHFLAVCFVCHNWIHSNPEEARKAGWLAPKGQWNTNL